MTLSWIYPLVIVLGIVSQWFYWKIRVPAILGHMFLGILIGPVLQLIHPSQEMGQLFDPMIKFSLAIILFEGGLLLRPYELKESGLEIRRLLTLNSLIAFLLTFIFGIYVFNLDIWSCLIVASILLVTGPTVILPMLRQAQLSKRVTHYLKWEGIINDPIGVLLAILVMEVAINFFESGSLLTFTQNFILASISAVILSFFLVRLLDSSFRRGLIPQYLKIPFIFAGLMITYFGPNIIMGETGLLGTTCFGIFFARCEGPVLDELRRFKEYLSTLLVPIVFILLSAELNRELFFQIDPTHILFFVVVTFVIRPVSIFLSTFKTHISNREKILLSLVGPRGIVCMMLSDYVVHKLISNGHMQSAWILPQMVVIIASSVVFSSLAIKVLPHVLGLKTQDEQVLIIGAGPWINNFCLALVEKEIHPLLIDNTWEKISEARMLGIKTHYGEVLSPNFEENFDTVPFKNIIAATPDNNYNSLICAGLMNEVGAENVHRLPTRNSKAKSPIPLTQGQYLVPEKFNIYELNIRTLLGWKFKWITFNENNYDFYWKQVVNGECIPILALKKDKKIQYYEDLLKTQLKIELNKFESVLLFSL